MQFSTRGYRGVGLAFAIVWLAGCAIDAPQREQRVASKNSSLPAPVGKALGLGRVESVREVMIESKSQSSGRSAQNTAAAVNLAQMMNGVLSPKQDGLELRVRLDNGVETKVVQTADVAFRPGDRVRVMQGYDGQMRVTY